MRARVFRYLTVVALIVAVDWVVMTWDSTPGGTCSSNIVQDCMSQTTVGQVWFALAKTGLCLAVAWVLGALLVRVAPRLRRFR